MREKRADQTDMGLCPDTIGECCNREAAETLSWHATVGGIKTEQIQVQECEMFRQCHKYEESSMQTVISTTTSHKVKRDETQPRVVTLEYADVMRVPEHYASTLRTRALRPATSRMMPKCRTRQFESRHTLSALFHAKPPKDPRLSDGWRWQLARVFFPLSPGVCTQWLPGSVHMATDAWRIWQDCLRPSSRASGRGQRGVLETSTAAETVVRRKGTRIALYLEPDRLDLQFAKKELTHDVQTPSMLSMLRLRRFAWYLVGGADLSPFFAYSDESSTMLAWADAH